MMQMCLQRYLCPWVHLVLELWAHEVLAFWQMGCQDAKHGACSFYLHV